MNDLTLFNLDLDLTLLDDETFVAELVAFAEMVQGQWDELLTEQSTLALL
ncbi:MAG: hypothetical protein PHG15_01395 [Acinetobacter sp.]|nr:hypothetical protein [Acinetobacter sp.]MDD2944474.1 hypothetical protein [Acinetobacter sp.]